MNITYYVHGSTKDNEMHLATGWLQTPLSAKGKEQTIIAASSINSLDYDGVFTSDLIRAIESAYILFQDRKDTVRIDPRLRECNYGDLTNTSTDNLSYLAHIEEPFPEGESLLDVELRMRNFLKEKAFLKYRNIAIVGHRAPQLAIEVITKQMTWENAISSDWRINGGWQLGWKYKYEIIEIK